MEPPVDCGNTLFVTLAIAVPSLIFVLTFAHHNAWFRNRLPPGSFGFPLIGESFQFCFHVWTDRLFLFTRIRRAKYGDIYKSHIFGDPYVFVSGAKAGRMMTVLEHKTFQAHQFHGPRHLLGPRSIMLLPEEPHKRFRSLASEAFSVERVKRSLVKIEQVALDVLDKWNVGDVVVMEQESTKFAFNFIAALVMSWMPGPITEKAANLAKLMARGAFTPPINLPGFEFHQSMKARQKLVEMFEDELKRRQSSAMNDILQSMLDYQDEQGNTLSKPDITDNLVTYILAGLHTSSITITFIIQFLDDEPHVLEQLRAEHADIRQAKAPNETLTWEDYKKMSFTQKVINEASRRASVIFWWHRRVAEEFEFEGYQVPKGWSIVFDVNETHNSDEYFKDPHTFNPWRFNEPPKPYTFMPWGGGPRLCLGMNLAKLEIAVFIHYLVLMYRWKTTQPNLGVTYFGLPSPKGGVPMLIKDKVQPCAHTCSL